MTEISASLVQDAIVEIMRSSLGRGAPVDTTAAATLAGRITPAARKLGIDAATSSVLSANSAFHSLVAQHLGSPTAAASTDPIFHQQLREAIERANIHGPDYLAGVRDGMRLGRMPMAGSESTRTSQTPGRSYERDLPNSTITAAALAPNLRGYVTEGVSAAHVASTAQYLERIGITPSAYTGHFLGTSQTFRNALEQHVKHGTEIRGNQIDNHKDLAGAFAAIDSGKADRSKVDPKIIEAYERARREGVDMRDAKSIQQWQEKQPELLKQLRTQQRAVDAHTANKTDQNLLSAIAPPSKPAGGDKPPPAAAAAPNT